jgi:hypothetical protein
MGAAGDAAAQTAAGNALFGGVGAVSLAGVRPLRSLPHAWQLVCPRKIRLAPQNLHVGFCVPCPCISLNLSSVRCIATSALPASMTSPMGRRIGPTPRQNAPAAEARRL